MAKSYLISFCEEFANCWLRYAPRKAPRESDRHFESQLVHSSRGACLDGAPSRLTRESRISSNMRHQHQAHIVTHHLHFCRHYSLLTSHLQESYLYASARASRTSLIAKLLFRVAPKRSLIGAGEGEEISSSFCFSPRAVNKVAADARYTEIGMRHSVLVADAHLFARSERDEIN